MTWATFGILLLVAIIVSAVVLVVDRRSGPVRAFLTVAAGFAGAWGLNLLARQMWELFVGGVFLVPAIVGALAAALLFRGLAERLRPRRPGE